MNGRKIQFYSLVFPTNLDSNFNRRVLKAKNDADVQLCNSYENGCVHSQFKRTGFFILCYQPPKDKR